MNPLENFASTSLSSSMSFIDLLNTTYEQPPSSSELQFRSDLPPLQKLPPVPNNQSFTEFTNSDSILLDMNNDEWFCSPGKEDDGGGADATGVVDGDFQVSVSCNLKGPPPDIVSRLQDIVQEPNVSPMEQEQVGLKTTPRNSSDTVLREFRIEDLEDELDEILRRKKRKREIRNNELKRHSEDLVNKMLKKQEDMYKVLLETMEQKEKDRIRREETWRNLERERMRKEKERRAQDTHRSLALLSLLQKFLGQKVINNPGPLAQQETNTPQSTEQQTINIHQFPEIITRDESDQRIHYWTNDEARALISLRLAIGKKFLAGATKFRMSWEVMSEEMSRGMASMGFTKTPKQCKDKWDSMNWCFNKAERSGKTPAENAKTCPYFQELDLFYKKLLNNLEKAPEAETEASLKKSSTDEHQSI